jgi:hypothetical protein
MTSRTFMDRTLHKTLAEVLLSTGLAMARAVSCQPEDTCGRCCSVLHIEKNLLRLLWLVLLQRRLLHCRFIFLVTEALYCFLQLYLSHSLMIYLLLHYLGSLGHCFPSDHLLLHESQMLIFLVKACQLILDDCFNLLF